VAAVVTRRLYDEVEVARVLEERPGGSDGEAEYLVQFKVGGWGRILVACALSCVSVRVRERVCERACACAACTDVRVRARAQASRAFRVHGGLAHVRTCARLPSSVCDGS
jgi:hypothetical protein